MGELGGKRKKGGHLGKDCGGPGERVVAVRMERISKLGEHFSGDVKDTYSTYSKVGWGVGRGSEMISRNVPPFPSVSMLTVGKRGTKHPVQESTGIQCSRN